MLILAIIVGAIAMAVLSPIPILGPIIAGFIGMKAATRANARTTEAARQYKPNPAKALSVAFFGGSVMGLAVASLGLLGVGALFIIYGDPKTAYIINGFAMGASTIAFFARVGGGIYTKTADVGSDLVGKVEAGIPEDDPRNPGVIADNVGDNVGDVAGLGADIFESYVGSMIASIFIAATAIAGSKVALLGSTEALMSLPVLLSMVGLVASVLGILAMKILQNRDPAAALRYATFIAAGLFLIFAFFAIKMTGIKLGVYWAVLIGCLSGIAIGLITTAASSSPP